MTQIILSSDTNHIIILVNNSILVVLRTKITSRKKNIIRPAIVRHGRVQGTADLICVELNDYKVPLDIPDNEPIFTISTAAKLVKVSVHTLRLYEREGLIIPHKDLSNRRMYSKKDLERVMQIRNLINSDKISISGIQTCLSLIPCREIKHCERTPDTCPVLSEKMKPCWLIKKDSVPCKDIDCRECEVYLSFSDCKQLKEKLLSFNHK